MSYMSNSLHYNKGDKPPPPASKLRVYGMRFCPFVHRLKLVMHNKGAEHESINCNTVNKPEWIFEKNPQGKVPIIEKDDLIICESDITSQYIDDSYPERGSLTIKDPVRKAKAQMLLKDLDKAISGIFTFGRAKDENQRKKGLELIEESLKYLEKYFVDSKTPFISGENIGMADYMFWPFLYILSILHKDLLSKSQIAEEYYEKMLLDKSVQACRHPDEIAYKFWKSYFAGAPEYDIKG